MSNDSYHVIYEQLIFTKIIFIYAYKPNLMSLLPRTTTFHKHCVYVDRYEQAGI